MSEYFRKYIKKEHYTVHPSQIRFKTLFKNCVLEALKRRGWKDTDHDQEWEIYWAEKEWIHEIMDHTHLNNNQKVNHFRNHYEIGKAQGKGIFLFNKLNQISQWKNDTRWKSEGPQVENYIVQRYINNPLLIGGKKFDMRIYCLVTSYTPLVAYLYRNGFARFTHHRYDNEDISNTFVHLTNVAIQKTSENYDDKLGGKWDLRTLKLYLMSRYGQEKVSECFSNIQTTIIRALQSVQKIIINDKHCFELYGFDILLDSTLKPWILEVNASPSMTANTPQDFELKCNLLDDAFTIIDMEKVLTGQEEQVGGFDLICKGTPIKNESSLFSTMLGCFNNRAHQLKKLAKVISTKLAQNYKDEKEENKKKIVTRDSLSSATGSDATSVGKVKIKTSTKTTIITTTSTPTTTNTTVVTTTNTTAPINTSNILPANSKAPKPALTKQNTGQNIKENAPSTATSISTTTTITTKTEAPNKIDPPKFVDPRIVKPKAKTEIIKGKTTPSALPPSGNSAAGTTSVSPNNPSGNTNNTSAISNLLQKNQNPGISATLTNSVNLNTTLNNQTNNSMLSSPALSTSKMTREPGAIMKNPPTNMTPGKGFSTNNILEQTTEMYNFEAEKIKAEKMEKPSYEGTANDNMEQRAGNISNLSSDDGKFNEGEKLSDNEDEE